MRGLSGAAARPQPGRLRRIGEAQAQIYPIAGTPCSRRGQFRTAVRSSGSAPEERTRASHCSSDRPVGAAAALVADSSQQAAKLRARQMGSIVG